jgi:hypothetical protein
MNSSSFFSFENAIKKELIINIIPMISSLTLFLVITQKPLPVCQGPVAVCKIAKTLMSRNFGSNWKMTNNKPRIAEGINNIQPILLN